MGRKNSMATIKGIIMISSIKVKKDRISLPPISMWLKVVKEQGRPIKERKSRA